MSGNFISNNCRMMPVRLATTVTTKCYTAVGFPQVIGVRLVNFHATATPKVSLQYMKATTGVLYYLQANLIIPVAGAIWLPYEGFALYENDELWAISDTANAIDVLTFISEVPGRSQ